MSLGICGRHITLAYFELHQVFFEGGAWGNESKNGAAAALAPAPAIDGAQGALRQPQPLLRTQAPTTWGSLAGAPAASVADSMMPALRLLGVGQLGASLDVLRRGLARIAPGAHVVGGSLDVFGSYKAWDCFCVVWTWPPDHGVTMIRSK
jgi:hypothetical protein